MVLDLVTPLRFPADSLPAVVMSDKSSKTNRGKNGSMGNLNKSGNNPAAKPRNEGSQASTAGANSAAVATEPVEGGSEENDNHTKGSNGVVANGMATDPIGHEVEVGVGLENGTCKATTASVSVTVDLLGSLHCYPGIFVRTSPISITFIKALKKECTSTYIQMYSK